LLHPNPDNDIEQDVDASESQPASEGTCTLKNMILL